MANAISAGRMILSIALLFVPTLSPAFYVFYILAGLTDMIDGVVLFILPLTFLVIPFKYSGAAVYAIATFAAA